VSASVSAGARRRGAQVQRRPLSAGRHDGVPESLGPRTPPAASVCNGAIIQVNVSAQTMPIGSARPIPLANLRNPGNKPGMSIRMGSVPPAGHPKVTAPFNTNRSLVSSSADIDSWRSMQSSSPEFANPFLSPQFAVIVGELRPNTRVAVLSEGSSVVGFFPFERHRSGAGEPVGPTGFRLMT
jgi:hypothetical protein